MKKIKILIIGDSPGIHSGFAKHIREVFTPLHQTGKYEIKQVGWWHVHSMERVAWPVVKTQMGKENGREMPLTSDAHGELTIPQAYKEFQPDIIWTNSDPWTLEHVAALRSNNNFIWVNSIAIDGSPMLDIFAPVLNMSDVIVPIMNYGTQVLNKMRKLKQNKIYQAITESVNTNTYKPYNKKEREIVHQKYLEPYKIYQEQLTKKGPPTCIGFVGRNQKRKTLFALYHTYALIYHKQYAYCPSCKKINAAQWLPESSKFLPQWDIPSCMCRYCYTNIKYTDWIRPRDNEPKFVMYLHTPPNDRAWSLPDLELQFDLRNKIIHTPGHQILQGQTETKMADIFNCFDIYLSFADEGFGLPLAEAMACKVPVISPAHGASYELTKTLNLNWYPNAYWMEERSNIARPLPHYSDILNLLFTTQENLDKRGQEAYKFITTEWPTWSQVAKQWDELFVKLVIEQEKLLHLNSTTIL